MLPGDLFRHVKIRFHWRELNYSNMQHFFSTFDNEDAPQDKTGLRLTGDHSIAASLLIGDRVDEIETAFDYYEMVLRRLLPSLGIITLDLTNLYCLAGCCRRKTLCENFPACFLNDFVRALVNESVLSNITIKGLKSEAEKDLAFGAWGFQECGDVDRAQLRKKWHMEEEDGTKQ